MVTCRACELSQGRTRVVPGEGPEHAEVMFIGEAPGFNEDKQGRPFVGAAGQFLESLLAEAGLQRSQVYIGNVVKCRPPNNRDPLPTEIAACKPWLDQQIALIRPKVIVTLGRFSMARWFPGQGISRIHGQAAERDGVTIVPMFHPAAALHQQALKSTIIEDFRRLPGILAGLRSVEPEPSVTAASTEPEPQQLSLF
jgi:DNA polymerase